MCVQRLVIYTDQLPEPTESYKSYITRIATKHVMSAIHVWGYSFSMENCLASDSGCIDLLITCGCCCCSLQSLTKTVSTRRPSMAPFLTLKMWSSSSFKPHQYIIIDTGRYSTLNVYFFTLIQFFFMGRKLNIFWCVFFSSCNKRGVSL